MKKIYTLIIVLVLAQQPVFSQYGQSTFDFSNLDFSSINITVNLGYNFNFGNFDFSNINLNNCCEDGNYKFGGTNFTQLNAGFQYEAAQKAALDNWYSAQRVLIETEIDKYFNKTFANYKEAVNATFIDYGKSNHKNFDYNLRNLKNKQIAISDDYEPQNKIKLIDLKLLQLRKLEINAGNINNSEYPYSKVNGIPLKDYRTINSINVNWNAIKTNLIPNLAKQQNANYFSIALNNLDSSFDTYLLNLQRTFYHDNLNHGQRLFLEQFCINILMAYRINPNAFLSPYETINYDIPDGLERGPLFMPTGTEEILENYLNIYTKTSVFDADYYLKVLDEILINNGWEPVYGDIYKIYSATFRNMFVNIARAKALERRNAELNRLVNEVEIIPTPCETALLSRDVYNTTNGQQQLGTDPIPNELSGGWVLNNSLDTSSMALTDPNSGFNSAVYQKLVNGVYQYMYVTEGSTLRDTQDWYNNISQVSGNSEQYEISVKNAEILNDLVGNNQLYFTGHSLGGGLASVNALATGRTAFTYNAAGLSYETLVLYNRGYNSEINATVVRGEIIDKIQRQFGIKAEDSNTINYIEEESTYWQDLFNESLPVLNTYNAVRLHTIDAIIDILDCE